ncbi:TetR/AcrR family transcriptional regulator [Alkalihalobacillus sp. BA299]|uniref:TetR/AcrR family transcriptional regulator n=1 Tax=Alkalihalobacillus sp. BA299 TaxID=2815938 RepID=UPI001ADD410F|nr:TetR/AcrR family transcriptional regulator [Alkalihalobacillus sp. BA299]
MKKLHIPSMVKNDQKIRKRRSQILAASIQPFKEKGFHRTTTREIAENAGMSFGAIYEYVESKEDILYLFFESLYDQLNTILKSRVSDQFRGLERLRSFVQQYFQVINEIGEETSIMYSESRSLPKPYLEYVLSKENDFVQYVMGIFSKSLQEENIILDEEQIYLLTHNIIVQGHMWAFRGWALRKRYTLEKYINVQTKILIGSIFALTE